MNLDKDNDLYQVYLLSPIELDPILSNGQEVEKVTPQQPDNQFKEESDTEYQSKVNASGINLDQIFIDNNKLKKQAKRKRLLYIIGALILIIWCSFTVIRLIYKSIEQSHNQQEKIRNSQNVIYNYIDTVKENENTIKEEVVYAKATKLNYTTDTKVNQNIISLTDDINTEKWILSGFKSSKYVIKSTIYEEIDVDGDRILYFPIESYVDGLNITVRVAAIDENGNQLAIGESYSEYNNYETGILIPVRLNDLDALYKDQKIYYTIVFTLNTNTEHTDYYKKITGSYDEKNTIYVKVDTNLPDYPTLYVMAVSKVDDKYRFDLRKSSNLDEGNIFTFDIGHDFEYYYMWFK